MKKFRLRLGAAAQFLFDTFRQVIIHWNEAYDRPFVLFGVKDVFLTPECLEKIPPRPGSATRLSGFSLPAGETHRIVREGQAVVLKFDGTVTMDVTAEYEATDPLGAGR